MAERRIHSSGIATLWPLLALIVGLGGAAWANTRESALRPLAPTPAAAAVEAPKPAPPASPPVRKEMVWSGADLDHDGQPDFANPTGKGVRGCDGFGCGGFGSRRDGGGRRHAGTDFDASPGQRVLAPISGFVTKIGEAYVDDGRYRFVEITNPAIRYVARVFYVDPSVREGQAVRLGHPIGRDHSLEPRYPGITNHVHLELSRLGKAKIDATRMIFTRLEDVPTAPAAPALAQAPQPAPARG
jgi:murein DD-endopeptidase MepM/ murein hydrolase activator NlpD